MGKQRFPELETEERTIGWDSEVRGQKLLLSQLFIVKAELTKPGHWYDIDAYLMEGAGFPFPFLRVEIKSYEPKRDEYIRRMVSRAGVAEADTWEWIVENAVVTLNCGETQDEAKITRSLYDQVDKLVTAYSGWDGQFEWILQTIDANPQLFH